MDTLKVPTTIIKEKISFLYEKLVRFSSKQNPIFVPTRVQRYYNHLVGFEYAEAVRKMVGEKEIILLIGDGGGRDYFYLIMHGKRVIAVDIAPQPIIPKLIRADAAHLPFRDATFDAVVCMEVLEHLLEDFVTLQEIRRVLKKEGFLILSVPFYHDIPEHHVRVYTPRTIKRLLEGSGFKIVEYVEKGGGYGNPCQLARLSNPIPRHQPRLCVYFEKDLLHGGQQVSFKNRLVHRKKQIEIFA